jgi:hypothetical protein
MHKNKNGSLSFQNHGSSRRAFLKAGAAAAGAALLGDAFSATSVSAAGENQKTEANKKSVQYLFVQTAHAVTSQGNKLTLHGVGPTTLFFSDRPERIVGHGATAELVKDWVKGEDSFASDPPNATLSMLGESGGEIEDVVVVLSNPQLAGSQLIYTVKVLDGKLPASGGPASLFIDVIGRPLTPLSVAGVARRTTRRVVRRRVH